MTRSEALDRGREGLRRRAWSDAFSHLAAALREGPLAAEDLEGLATAAHLTGREAEGAEAMLAGTESGHVPFPIDGVLGRFVLIRIVRFIGHHVLTVSTPVGRRARPRMLSRAAPLVRVKPDDLVRAGVERVPRVAGAREGRPLLADGRTLAVSNVVWCTGYHAGFSWIDLPIFGDDGRPRHERGIVADAPGMYFVGLHYLYAMTSATLAGVGRDAAHVVSHIAARRREARAA
jgi:putative flavoprotein involved in K+ transport